MTVNQAVAQLLEIEERRKGGVCGPATLAIGMARVGQGTQCIVSGTLQEIANVDFGPPLHSLVLVGTMHEMEQALFDHFRVQGGTPRLAPAAAGSGTAAAGEGADGDGDGAD
jgi:diphthine synthase